MILAFKTTNQSSICFSFIL